MINKKPSELNIKNKKITKEEEELFDNPFYEADDEEEELAEKEEVVNKKPLSKSSDEKTSTSLAFVLDILQDQFNLLFRRLDDIENKINVLYEAHLERNPRLVLKDKKGLTDYILKVYDRLYGDKREIFIKGLQNIAETGFEDMENWNNDKLNHFWNYVCKWSRAQGREKEQLTNLYFENSNKKAENEEEKRSLDDLIKPTFFSSTKTSYKGFK